MPESAPKTIAEAHSVDVVEVYCIFKCMLRSVVATGQIDPCYQQWRSQAALYDINVSEAYAKLQVMLQASSRNKAIAVVPAVRPPDASPIAPRDVLCQDILDQCSLETGKIQSSALQAIADAHNVKVSRVRGVFRCILRSVAATGEVDPSYQMELSQSSLSDINKKEAYAKLLTILQARSQNNRATAKTASIARPQLNRTIEPINANESPMRAKPLHTVTTTVAETLPRRLLPVQWTAASRNVLCQAILDQCSLETGQLETSAPQAIADAYDVHVDTVYGIYLTILRSVVATGQVDPSYQTQGSQSELSDIYLTKAYAKLRFVLQKRSQGDRVAAVPASTSVPQSASEFTDKCLEAQMVDDKQVSTPVVDIDLGRIRKRNSYCDNDHALLDNDIFCHQDEGDSLAIAGIWPSNGNTNYKGGRAEAEFMGTCAPSLTNGADVALLMIDSNVDMRPNANRYNEEGTIVCPRVGVNGSGDSQEMEHLSSRLRDLLCQAILDHCSLETGRIQASALQSIADAHHVNFDAVNGVLKSILRSVAATGQVDPSYQKELYKAALSDINLKEAYAKLQTVLWARSQSDRGVAIPASAALVTSANACTRTAIRHILCQEILDQCRWGRGRLKASALKAIADAHRVNVVAVYGILKCILLSVAATGQVDPNYQQGRSKVSLSDINVKEAYAKLQNTTMARSRNNRVAALPPSAALPQSRRSIEPIDTTECRTRANPLYTETAMVAQTMPRNERLLPVHLTAAFRNVLCQAILEECSLETGQLEKSAFQAIADAHNVNFDTVCGIFLSILRSVAVTGQVDPGYQMERAQSALPNVNLNEAYAKLQTILMGRSQSSCNTSIKTYGR